MSTHRFHIAPFWYFGNKRKAAAYVWQALGDVDVYVEPFGGSLATLLLRPHPPSRNRVEIANDLDGYVVNFFRSVQRDPDTVVQWASWPITEIDFNARRMELVQWRIDGTMEKLWTDPYFYDPKIAGIWVWAHNLSVGGSITQTNGPWWKSSDRKLVYRELTRRQRFADTQGIGISLSLPNISTFRGILHPDVTTSGISASLPTVESVIETFFANEEQALPELPAEVPVDEPFYTFVEAKAKLWLKMLQSRLRYTIFLCRSWEYLVSHTVLYNAIGMQNRLKNKAAIGIFLDPPYSFEVRDATKASDLGNGGLYLYDLDIAASVRTWCLEHGHHPQYRIVLAGFEGEGHEILLDHGWKEVQWWKHNITTRGYKNRKRDGVDRTQQHRERLWVSPHCLPIEGT